MGPLLPALYIKLKGGRCLKYIGTEGAMEKWFQNLEQNPGSTESKNVQRNIPSLVMVIMHTPTTGFVRGFNFIITQSTT
jgi:hypothetical protein